MKNSTKRLLIALPMLFALLVAHALTITSHTFSGQSTSVTGPTTNTTASTMFNFYQHPVGFASLSASISNSAPAATGVVTFYFVRGHAIDAAGTNFAYDNWQNTDLILPVTVNSNQLSRATRVFDLHGTMRIKHAATVYNPAFGVSNITFNLNFPELED